MAHDSLIGPRGYLGLTDQEKKLGHGDRRLIVSLADETLGMKDPMDPISNLKPPESLCRFALPLKDTPPVPRKF
ncbi:MAG: hypothetical protein VX189_14565 [Planctomycetota bacterium]|nr:hypothetical protein [Planctomycetota bacterium]